MGSWLPYEKQGNFLDWFVGFMMFLFICYLFVGIAVASDIFMNAIEKICGSTKLVKRKREEDGVIIVDTKEVQVWNDTVANLTLMALGSSAPEILLSAIEISEGLGLQHPGDLGPGTIVGSAAYNLLMISAVCIMSKEDGTTSRIKIYQVFVVTSVVSLFAYIWMVVVLQWVSPDEVTLWEALVTLAMCPMLVLMAYWADQEFCLNGQRRKSSIASGTVEANGSTTQEDGGRNFFFGDDSDRLYDEEGNVDHEALHNLYNKLTEVADLTPEEIASILATKLIQGKQHSRMWYRMQASRGIMGGAKLLPVLNEKLQEVVHVINESTEKQLVRGSILQQSITSPDTYKKKAVIEFQAATLAVSESVGEFKVIVNRSGKEDVGCKVHIESSDGTAKKGKEYVAVSENIMIDPYMMEQTFTVKIIDNVQWNPDSNFFLKLSIPSDSADRAVAGQMYVMEIIIEDDDKPGKLSFSKRGYVIKAASKKGNVEVERVDGTDGVISVTWTVVPGPKCTLATADMTGVVEFQHGEMKKFIEIPLKKAEGKVVGQDETFDVELSNAQGGAKLGRIPKTTCAVSTDDKFKLEVKNVMNMALEMNEEAEKDISYKDQIVQAFYVNGGDVKNATNTDWVLHIVTFPFKFSFSLIPPPHVGGGWLCFFCALGCVGFLTKVVGDSAGTFGYIIGIDPTITAITFVALGTSLPDTFASRIAAINDKTADNAIGNVTGSNSVNVFLGLGVPWTIGTIYYSFHVFNPSIVFFGKKNAEGQHEPFCVPAGSLTFNVLVFSVCAFISLAILTYRRYAASCGRSELGGPRRSKRISAVVMIVLWFVYIGLSSMQVIMAGRGNDISEPLTGTGPPTACKLLVQQYLSCNGKLSCTTPPTTTLSP